MEIPGYQIDREIGKGGMATVYLAVQESLERSVVLKVLDKVKHATQEDMALRFIGEGRIIASLQHPNIITIYDIGLSGEKLYISMEYVRGGDLKKRLKSHVSPKTALDVVTKIGAALASAHDHKIIHRDVKPANILFKDDETPLLTDFGIAKQVDHDKDLTSTGIFLGSPNYASPEQADGKRIDERSDIYSLGCIFYEMLNGCKPYYSDSIIDIIIQHKTSPIPSLSEPLSKYQPLLDKMMAKNPDERFTSADELVKAIDKFRSEEKTEYIMSDLDISWSLAGVSGKKKNKRKSMVILIPLLIVSVAFFFGLQFVEIKIKSPKNNFSKASTNTSLPTMTLHGNNLAKKTLDDIQTSKKTKNGIHDDVQIKNRLKPVSDDVINALNWLGHQSLDEFRLTYPPKDNAYYYFSRLLELQPDNQTAYNGILNIAERYALLAEKSLANNEIDKAKAYIGIGLQIDPNNQTLLAIKDLLAKKNDGFINKIKSLFYSKPLDRISATL